MNPTTHKPHRTSKGECCTESSCEWGLRNNYFDGKRLTTDSFRVEQTYMLGRRQLLNRAIHGWGVVYGYELSASDPKQGDVGKLKVGAGLALDKCGRELVETGTSIQFKDVSLLDKDGKQATLEDVLKSLGIDSGFSWNEPPQAVIDALDEWCWELSVHYAERDRAHVKIEDHCCCKRDEWDQICETVHYSLKPIECDRCCKPFPCELECGCGTGPCCEEKQPPDDPQRINPDAQGNNPDAQGNNPDPYGNNPDPQAVNPPTTDFHQRGGCQCLCKHLTTGVQIGGECDALCEIEEPCGNLRVDLKNSVPLACVKLVADKCGPVFGSVTDACGPRRLVKRNDLLFDLIRGCDLTRISDFSWKQWHRGKMSFDDFSKLLGIDGSPQQGDVTTKFWLDFSRPVRAETVLLDCFVITIITDEGQHDGWWGTLRVPIVGVELTPGDSPRAHLVVDGAWFQDLEQGAITIFQNRKTRVEVEVRGDFIVDCNGQTIDSNAHGLPPLPIGNGTPGGTFLSTFLVEPAPRRPDSYQTKDRTKGVL